LLVAAAPALATARPPAPRAGSFATSFEAGQPQPTWTSTPEVNAQGQKMASGVSSSSILERGPSSPGGDDLLGHPTGELAWQGPFQNGVGQVPGTITPTTTPSGDSATHWTMQSQVETWIQVLMPDLTP